MVRRPQWKPEGLGRPRTRAYTSCCSLWIDALGVESQTQTQFLHRRNGRSRSLEERSNYLISSLVNNLQRRIFNKHTSHTSDTVNDALDQFLSNCVMAPCIIVGSILLATNQELRVKELTIVASADLINWGGIQINKD